VPHIIEIEDLRTLVETDLVDAALELELSAAEAELDRIAGPLGEVREYHRGGGYALILHRFAGSIRIVREPLASADLVASAWRLDPDRRSLWRLDSSGLATTWADGLVSVYYQPSDDLALRQAVAVALVRGAITGVPGVLGMTEGNFSIQFANGQTWSSVRDDVLSSAARPWGFG